MDITENMREREQMVKLRCGVEGIQLKKKKGRKKKKCQKREEKNKIKVTKRKRGKYFTEKKKNVS